MAKTRPYELVRVAPSMVRSVFAELKANGYSDHQILALSDGLMRMADSRLREKVARKQPQDLRDAEQSEEFESVCAAGLPRQM